MLQKMMNEFNEVFQQIKAVLFALIGFSLGVTIMYFLGLQVYNKLVKPFITYMNWDVQMISTLASLLGGV